MHRYFIRLSYLGTPFNGWQIQQNTPNTVQEIIQKNLSKLLQEEIEVVGCGRTDTGVHALDYYAHFDSQKNNLSDGKTNWIYKFNSVLPSSIAIKELFPVSATTHARFDALSRTYHYKIHQKKNPFLENQSYYNATLLDVEKMNKACKLLFNYTDFTSFSKLHTQTKTNNCKISAASWTQHGDNLLFEITADRFLRNMVRAIVGTLLEIGKNKININDLSTIIESKNRSNAGTSVPACGLYLTQIAYPIELLNSKQNY